MSAMLALMQMGRQSAGGLLGALLSIGGESSFGQKAAVAPAQADEFNSILDGAKKMAHTQAVNTQARKLKDALVDALLNGRVDDARNIIQQVPQSQRSQFVADIKDILFSVRPDSGVTVEEIAAVLEKIQLSSEDSGAAKNSPHEVFDSELWPEPQKHGIKTAELTTDNGLELHIDYESDKSEIIPVESALYKFIPLPLQAVAAHNSFVAASKPESAVAVNQIDNVAPSASSPSSPLLAVQEIFADAGAGEFSDSANGGMVEIAIPAAEIAETVPDSKGFSAEMKPVLTALSEWKSGWQHSAETGAKPENRGDNPVPDLVQAMHVQPAEIDAVLPVVADVMTTAPAVVVAAADDVVTPALKNSQPLPSLPAAIPGDVDAKPLNPAVDANIKNDNQPADNGASSKGREFAALLNDYVADSGSNAASPSVATDRSNVSEIVAQLRPGESRNVDSKQPLFSVLPQSSPAEQVNVHIKMALQGGADQIKVHLNPAELGQVDVKMEIAQDGSIKLHMVAERQDTLDMLRGDSRELSKTLQQSGFKVDSGSMQFSLRDDGQAQQQALNQYNQQRGNNGQGFNNNQPEMIATNDDEFLPQQITRTSHRLGVDISI